MKKIVLILLSSFPFIMQATGSKGSLTEHKELNPAPSMQEFNANVTPTTQQIFSINPTINVISDSQHQQNNAANLSPAAQQNIAPLTQTVATATQPIPVQEQDSCWSCLYYFCWCCIPPNCLVI